jgi:hypothetical protein
VYVDQQNYDDAGFFGAPLVFIPHQVPDTPRANLAAMYETARAGSPSSPNP